MRSSMQSSRRRPWVLLIGVVALAACERATAPDATSATRLGEPSFAAGGDVTLPLVSSVDFHAVEGSAAITCSPNGAGISYTVTASQYLGQGPSRFFGMSTATTTFVSCATVLQPLGDDLLVFTSTGTFTVVAANGDELHGTFTMKQYASGKFVSESGSISGGTGRFANATGDISVTGWLDRTTHVGYWTMTGTMSRPSS